MLQRLSGDRDGYVPLPIAGYPRDAIVDAIAIFSGKHTAGTLPEGVDARYLLGIVRNLHHRYAAEPLAHLFVEQGGHPTRQWRRTVQAGVDYATDGEPWKIAAADRNDDGTPDLAMVSGAETLSLLFGKPDGTFQSRVDTLLGVQPVLLTVGPDSPPRIDAP